MQLVCPKCRNAIPGVDLDVTRGVGVCRPCGEIVPFAMAVEKSKMFVPAAFRFDESLYDGVYVARMPPHRAAALPLLGFCFFWDAFLAIWYGVAIAGGAWHMALFGLLHLAAGVFLTHRAFVALLNSREIRMGHGRFKYANEPVPFAGRMNLPLDQIDSFDAIDTSSSRTQSSAVRVRLTNGRAHKIDVGSTDRDATAYAAASLNAALDHARDKKRVALGAGDPYRGEIDENEEVNPSRLRR